MADAAGDHKPGTMPFGHPVEMAVPLALAAGQFLGRFGAIGKKVILAEPQDGRDHVLAIGAHAIRHRVDQAE